MQVSGYRRHRGQDNGAHIVVSYCVVAERCAASGLQGTKQLISPVLRKATSMQSMATSMTGIGTDRTWGDKQHEHSTHPSAVEVWMGAARSATDQLPLRYSCCCSTLKHRQLITLSAGLIGPVDTVTTG